MQCLYILLTTKNVQYGVGFFSTLRLFQGTVSSEGEGKKRHVYDRPVGVSYFRVIRIHLFQVIKCASMLVCKYASECKCKDAKVQGCKCAVLFFLLLYLLFFISFLHIVLTSIFLATQSVKVRNEINDILSPSLTFSSLSQSAPVSPSGIIVIA